MGRHQWLDVRCLPRWARHDHPVNGTCPVLPLLLLYGARQGTNIGLSHQVAPKLTDYFGTVADVGWYESAYILAVYVETSRGTRAHQTK